MLRAPCVRLDSIRFNKKMNRLCVVYLMCCSVGVGVGLGLGWAGCVRSRVGGHLRSPWVIQHPRREEILTFRTYALDIV